jgi:hypothetical protein
LIGAVFMLLAERRLPSRTRHTSHRVVRIGVGVAVTVAASFVLLAVAVLALVMTLIF